MQRLLLLLFIFPFAVKAQLTPEQLAQVDSIQKVIASAKHDTIIVNAWIAWDKIIYVSDYNLDYVLNQKIDSLCSLNLEKKLSKQERRAFLKAKAFALGSFGIIYQDNGEYDKSIGYHTQSLKIQEEINDKKGMASSLGNIGLIYQDRGQIPQAIENFSRCLKIFEELGDKSGMAGSYNNMGSIYLAQNDFNKALDYFQKGLKSYEAADDPKGVALVLGNIGEVYFDQGDLTNALDYYSRSLKKAEEIGYMRGIATNSGYLGNVYRKKEDLDKAIEFYLKSEKIFRKIEDYYGLAFALTSLTETYVAQNNFSKAAQFGSKALEVSKMVGTNDLVSSAAETNYKIQKNLGRYKEALELYELHIVARDSMLSEENQKETFRQLYKYEYEKQAAADSIRTLEEKKVKDAEIARQQAEIKARKNQQYMLYGGLFLLVAFAGFMFNRYKVTQKQKGIIEEQKHIVEEKNKEITDSINYAKRIQAAILPPSRIVKEYLPESFILYKPKDIVAGDFYWMETVASTNSTKVLFAAADCTGHGVPGAMVSVVCNNALNRAVREYGLTDPGKILDKTREIVISEFEKSEEDVKDGMDISLCAINGNTLHWAGANNPLWIIRNGELIEVKPDKQPIGKYAEAKPFTTHQLELQKGDTLYIFTDGFADQFGGDSSNGLSGKKFKAANFKKLLLSIQSHSIDEQCKLIDEAFEKWRGSFEQIDDVCVIGVRI